MVLLENLEANRHKQGTGSFMVYRERRTCVALSASTMSQIEYAQEMLCYQGVVYMAGW